MNWYRSYQSLLESPSEYYHGSDKEFSVGTRLTPQNEGYVQQTNNSAIEEIMERNRPEGCVSRKSAVFLVDDMDDIDNVGGSTDYIYRVTPSPHITKCNLSWYTIVQMILEGEEGDVDDAALKYWTADPTGDGDVFEYLCDYATVEEMVEDNT